MSSKVMEISQLPSELEAQLQKVGEFYICAQFDKNVVGPPIAKIGENIYYRFMNFFYLPQPPESLTAEQTRDICDLRLEYLDKLVDFELNRRIVAATAACVATNVANAASPIKALDFGCGSGLSSQLLTEYISNLEIVGVDISKKAIRESQKRGWAAVLTFPGERLPFEPASFDLIFAIFVMHFNVGLPTLIELRRILQASGKIVFNVYQRDIDGVIEQLHEAGFGSIERYGIDGLDARHMIVSGGLPASTS